MTFFPALHAREHGSNKKNASQSCALSMVRQLFHLNIIEAYTGITKKKTTDEVSSLLFSDTDIIFERFV